MCPQCSKCEQPAVYLRRYTSEALCKGCIVKTTEERVRRTINRNKMLLEKDRIAVAISGGKDSAVLLEVLFRIEQDFPGADIVPFTIDEGIRGYRDEALKAARRLVDSLGMKLEVRTFQDLYGVTLDEVVKSRDEKGLGACSYCGVLRRRAMNDIARELHADVVATGHNLDDEAQTVIMNLMRGDGRRIARMSRSRDQVLDGFVPRVKPLSELSERDVVAYAYHTGLPYHDIPCPYSDEAFRNDLRAFLNQMEYKRPGTLLAVMHSAEGIAEMLQRDSVQDKTGNCERCGAPTASKICKTCEMLDSLRG